MKLRKRVRRAVRVLSCNGRNITRYTFVIICAIILFGCVSTKDTQQETSSWEMYCEKYEVDPVHPSVEQENFYLDCYIGSVEEENDFAKKGVML